ncbi:teicoplanin resistance protein VanZ [Shewanella gelidii]|uniref:Teicoplanin resistance protein VanZ n=1 Tax=Shewanella gelidii TaxID=1642821 RepID=A0A917JJM5_9GAMM|nr:teicoplanin resistance protein VanZ [Shewanella gelidii]
MTLVSHLIMMEKTTNSLKRVFTKQNLFKLTLLIALLIISYLVFSRPNYSQSIAHIDKVGHFGSFFVLSFLSYFAFKPKWYIVATALGCYAIAIELIQAKLPYRSASTADFIADMAGVASFYLLLWLANKWRKPTTTSVSK